MNNKVEKKYLIMLESIDEIAEQLKKGRMMNNE